MYTPGRVNSFLIYPDVTRKAGMKPVVSVLTITYNHAPYIRRCIESILMQKTTFPFELVIGEDCSTDGTREIVMDYAKDYPDVIRIITSETNVGALANYLRAYSACQGEFTALCDGDDYWIDPLKLQKQYDAILKYDAVLVTHRVLYLTYQGDKLISSEVTEPNEASGFLKTEDIILKKYRAYTSAIFFRTNIKKLFPEWIPDFVLGLDTPLILFASSIGKIYFINEMMSVYQHGIKGSWTFEQDKKVSSDKSWRADFETAYLEMYKKLDKFAEYRYSEAIQVRIQARIRNYYNKYGNLDFLEISEWKKKSIRMIADISRIAPGRLNIKSREKLSKMLLLPFMDNCYSWLNNINFDITCQLLPVLSTGPVLNTPLISYRLIIQYKFYSSLSNYRRLLLRVQFDYWNTNILQTCTSILDYFASFIDPFL